MYTLWTKKCSYILSTVTGTHSPRLHSKVCNPVHWRHTYIQQHLRRPPQSLGIDLHVLQTLGRAHLKIQMEKCWFARNSFKFLSHLIIPNWTGPNKKSIEAVTSFLRPAKRKDVRVFLGLCNYYVRFIKNYSVLAGQLLQSLKKSATFQWHSHHLGMPFWHTQMFLSRFHCVLTLVEIVLDLTSLRYNMVENVPLFMVD